MSDEDLTTKEGRKKKVGKGFLGQAWTRWKARRANDKIKDLVRATVASVVAGGMALGTIGYYRANDAQNTIRDNQAAWLQDLNDAQLAAANAQEVADKAASDALTAKNVAVEAKNSADVAQQRAADAETKAAEASSKATAAQVEANQAKAEAATAQTVAAESKEVAVEAQKVADKAAIDLLVARTDLTKTQEEVDALEVASNKAQTAADEAQADATMAQSTADRAVADAIAAQTAADEAREEAVAAQTAADNAQASADDARAIALKALAAAEAAQTAADEAQARADEAFALAQQAFDIAPKLTVGPPQFILDDQPSDIYNTPPSVSVTLGPGTYIVSAGAHSSVAASSRIRVNGTVYFTAGRVGFWSLPDMAITVPDGQSWVIQLEHDGPCVGCPITISNPYINVQRYYS